MKKVFIMFAAALICVAANAQEKYYGSKKGGFAVSFNANPLLNYAGNLFNGTQNNSLEDFKGLKNEMFSGTTITGKYMLKDNISIDLGFGFDNNYTTTYSYKGYEGSEDFDEERGYDKKSNTAFMIKAGMSYLLRPGKKFQPIAGASIVYCHSNEYENSEYDSKSYDGNPINKLGLIANVGVEYFIISQMSIGATIDFGIHKTWKAKSYDNDSGDGYRIDETKTKFATGNFGGNISLNFYF